MTPIAIASSYEELVMALNLRRQQLGLSMEALEDRAGLAGGHAGKLFGGKRVKNLGPLSLLLLLGALNCELMLTPREHDANDPRRTLKLMAKFLEQKRVAGRISGIRLSARQRRLRARKAARVRWTKWREVRAHKDRKAKRAKPFAFTLDPSLPTVVITTKELAP